VDLGWIWTGNLRPLAAELARLTGYQFSDSDWIAIEYGVQQTDSEAGQWFEYPVGRLVVTLALEPGADEMVSVKIDGAAESEQQQIVWLGHIMRNWHLSGPSPAWPRAGQRQPRATITPRSVPAAAFTTQAACTQCRRSARLVGRSALAITAHRSGRSAPRFHGRRLQGDLACDKGGMRAAPD
jgi:hypothetical protein